MKELDWNSLTIQKHIKEATALGLTILGAGKGSDYRLYKFNKCGHTRELKAGHVRDNKFSCIYCKEIKFSDEAAAQNLRIIGPAVEKHYAKSSNWRNYQFLKCKHQQDITLRNVRTGLFICVICRNKQLKIDAKKIGLILIKIFFKKDEGKQTGRTWATYKFKECHHLKTERIDVVQRGDVRCTTCLKLKLRREAKKAGLLIVGEPKEAHRGSSRESNWRNYQFLECGHTQDITLNSVRKLAFVCNSCFETSLQLPSNLYLLSIKVGSFEWLKFGYSKNVSMRIEQYGLPKKATIKKLKIIKYKTGREAIDAESAVNHNTKTRKIFFRKMKQYHTRSGYTECYPMEMKETLLKELSNLESK